MALRTYWYDAEQTIYVTEVEGVWTMDDFYKYFEETEKLITSIPHDVVLISDMSRSGRAPKQLLSAGRFMSKRRLPNVRLTITVGVSQFGQMLVSIMAKAYPSIRRGVLAQDMADAIRLAREALEEAKQAD
jgi:hypothetical protein